MRQVHRRANAMSNDPEDSNLLVISEQKSESVRVSGKGGANTLQDHPLAADLGLDVVGISRHDSANMNRPESHLHAQYTDSTILDLLMRTNQTNDSSNTLLSTYNYRARKEPEMCEGLPSPEMISESDIKSNTQLSKPIPLTSHMTTFMLPNNRQYIQDNISHNSHRQNELSVQAPWDLVENINSIQSNPVERSRLPPNSGSPSLHALVLPSISVVGTDVGTLSSHNSRVSTQWRDNQTTTQYPDVLRRQTNQQEGQIPRQRQYLGTNTIHDSMPLINSTSEKSFRPSASLEHTPRSHTSHFPFDGESFAAEESAVVRDMIAPLQSRPWHNTAQMQRHTSAPYVYRRNRGLSAPNTYGVKSRHERRRGSSPNIHRVISGSDETLARANLQSLESKNSPSILFTESGLRTQQEEEQTRAMHMQDGMAMLQHILSLNDTRATAGEANVKQIDVCINMQLDSPRALMPVNMPSTSRGSRLISTVSAPNLGQTHRTEGTSIKQIRWRSEIHKGVMHIKFATSSLLGYPRDGTTLVMIEMDTGQSQKAYFPNNAEGERVWLLLAEAFTRGLLLKTAQRVNVKDTNFKTKLECAVELKERRTGGISNGAYPDPKYLTRVKVELDTLLRPKQ